MFLVLSNLIWHRYCIFVYVYMWHVSILAITHHRLVVIQMVLLQDPDSSSVFSSLLQADNNIYFAILTMHFSILEFAFGIDFPAFPVEQIC